MTMNTITTFINKVVTSTAFKVIKNTVKVAVKTVAKTVMNFFGVSVEAIKDAAPADVVSTVLATGASFGLTLLALKKVFVKAKANAAEKSVVDELSGKDSRKNIKKAMKAAIDKDQDVNQDIRRYGMTEEEIDEYPALRQAVNDLRKENEEVRRFSAPESITGISPEKAAEYSRRARAARRQMMAQRQSGQSFIYDYEHVTPKRKGKKKKHDDYLAIKRLNSYYGY